jgi:dolichol-phosphate mannosyltransferase
MTVPNPLMETNQSIGVNATKKLSIIVPVYFNELSLPKLFEELVKVETTLQQTNVEMELLFVDDGSGDGSLGELFKIKQVRPATKIIKLTRNFGAVHATNAGFQFVTGDCFIVIAADLQDSTELIPTLVDKWLHGSKFVICKRVRRNDPWLSKVFAYFFYGLVRFFVIEKFPRRGYDLALMDRAMLGYMQNTSKNINPPLFAYWLGFQPDVILYERKKRAFGKSRWTFRSKVTLFLDSLLGFSIAPIRMISLIGLLVSLMSFGYGVWIMISALRGRTIVQGFATIVTVTSLLLGLVIIMLGVIGEYVWRIFDEINKRPESVIEQVF